MYIRFESHIWETSARCNQGVFCIAFDVWYDQPDLRDLWQVQEMRRILDWFNLYLDAPERTQYRAFRKAQTSGVFWFRTTSNRVISQARYMAWLLGDIGHPITEKRARNPGRILWQDAYQVVAAKHL